MVLAFVAPFSFGGIMPAGSAVIEVLAFLCAAAAYASKLKAPPLGRVRAAPWALVGIALLGLVQLVPLASPVLSTVSPASARLYREAGQVLSAFAGLASTPSPLSPRISIAPSETADTVLLVLAYLAAFLASVRLLARRSRRRVFAGALLGGALLQILLGVAEQLSEERLRGPFYNPDHFAGWLQISLALSLAVLWIAAHRAREAVVRSRNRKLDLERAVGIVGAAVLLWGVLAAAIGMTRSRGGILAASLATLVLLGLWGAASWSRAKRHVTGAGLVLAGLLFAAAATGRGPLLRFLATDPRDMGSDTRVTLWGLSVDAWKNFPVFGSGLGTFREAFRLVQPRQFEGLVEQAHHDFLQLLVTGGALGALLGTVAALSLLAWLGSHWHRQTRTEERAFALAGFGALLSLLLHGLVEFNMSLPATPVTLATVMGLSLAAVRYGGPGSPSGSGLES